MEPRNTFRKEFKIKALIETEENSQSENGLLKQV